MRCSGCGILLAAVVLIAGCSEFSGGDQTWLRLDCSDCQNPADPASYEGYVRGEYVDSPGDGMARIVVQAFETPRSTPDFLDSDGLEVGAAVEVPIEALVALDDQQEAFEERRRLRAEAVELVGSFEYDIRDEAIALVDALDAAGADEYARWLRANTTLRRVWHRDYWSDTCLATQEQQGPQSRCYLPDALWAEFMEELKRGEGSERAFTRIRETFDPVTGRPVTEDGEQMFMGGGYATLGEVGIAQQFAQFCTDDVSALQKLGVINRREIRTIRERCMRVVTADGARLPDDRTFAQLVTASTDYFVGFDKLE